MRLTRIIATVLCAVVLAIVPVFAACSDDDVTVTNISYSADGFVIYYSDGSINTIDVDYSTEDLVEALYQKYIEEIGEDISFSDFLEYYLTFSDASITSNINKTLLSCVKIYTEFVTTSYSSGPGNWGQPSYYYVTGSGSGVIYSMGSAYTYIVTNYHVVFDNDAVTSEQPDKIARRIVGYLYGSESEPVQSGTQYGYPYYDYGDYGIELEYVGGSISKDIAVLRCDTADILAVNEAADDVTLASGYHVGETAITVGNANDKGLSVTKGIISTDNDTVYLAIDNTTRTYRSLRIDAVVYTGNSGGGLFNSSGELIGIVNSGSATDESINYAIPLETVTGTADSIIAYSEDGDDTTSGAYAVDFGIDEVTSKNSKYVYDSSTGFGSIEEDVVVSEVSGIASSLGIKEGDIIDAVIINDVTYYITRTFNLDDIALTVRSGDIIQFEYTTSSGEASVTYSYTVTSSNLSAVA